MEIHGNLVDIHQKAIVSAKIRIDQGIITAIEPNTHRKKGFILPGFIDPFHRLESSHLTPAEYARLVVRHGTVATLLDTQSITDVLGISGLEMIRENAKKSALKFFFSASPSPDLKEILSFPEIKCLQVAKEDSHTKQSIALAKEFGKKIAGYAPGLYGEKLKEYVSLGIAVATFITSLSEGREKLALGLDLLIREGSVKKDLDLLFPLIQEYFPRCMVGTGDISPDDLMRGHINLLVKRAVQKGMDPIDAITLVSKNPAEKYQLDVGLLRVGDPADLIIVEDLQSFRVLETYIDGDCVFKDVPLLPSIPSITESTFTPSLKSQKDFAIPCRKGKMHVIELGEKPGWTQDVLIDPLAKNGRVSSDLQHDLLKVAALPFSRDASLTLGFVKGYGLQVGAIALNAFSQILAIGSNDEDLCEAINTLIQQKGGIVLCHQKHCDILLLPFAGLYSLLPAEELAVKYSELKELAQKRGCLSRDPFLMLAMLTDCFLPELKINGSGLFSTRNGAFISLFDENFE